jgi:prepilin-type N-terminal cleavage/methylation domain-containing protein
MSPTRKRGFTLVELLVVIAVIGILVAMLLPAVQAAREAARRSDCSNNLKQIALGLHLYHDIHRRFPSGWIANAPTEEPGWGWQAHTLPFLEQQPLYQNFARTHLPIGHAANQQARETLLPFTRCPSDPGEALVNLIEEATGAPLFPVARSNYIGMFGTLEIEDDPDLGDGMFFRNSQVRFADVIDGLSNTLMIGERSSKIDGSTWTGAVPGAEEGLARVVGSADHVPNDPHAHFDDFSSHHPTGAQFALADGSVRLITDQIELMIYHGLATRGGAEPVQAP